MSTNAEFITDSLRELGVINEIQSATPEQGAFGLTKLNDMMAEFSQSLRLEWFEQTDLAAACPIAPENRSALLCLLAVRMAANFGATVSPELAATTGAGWNRLLRTAINREMPEADLRNRNRAEGWRGRWNVILGP